MDPFPADLSEGKTPTSPMVEGVECKQIHADKESLELQLEIEKAMEDEKLWNRFVSKLRNITNSILTYIPSPSTLGNLILNIGLAFFGPAALLMWLGPLSQYFQFYLSLVVSKIGVHAFMAVTSISTIMVLYRTIYGLIVRPLGVAWNMRKSSNFIIVFASHVGFQIFKFLKEMFDIKLALKIVFTATAALWVSRLKLTSRVTDYIKTWTSKETKNESMFDMKSTINSNSDSNLKRFMSGILASVVLTSAVTTGDFKLSRDLLYLMTPVIEFLTTVVCIIISLFTGKMPEKAQQPVQQFVEESAKEVIKENNFSEGTRAHLTTWSDEWAKKDQAAIDSDLNQVYTPESLRKPSTMKTNFVPPSDMNSVPFAKKYPDVNLAYDEMGSSDIDMNTLELLAPTWALDKAIPYGHRRQAVLDYEDITGKKFCGDILLKAGANSFPISGKSHCPKCDKYYANRPAVYDWKKNSKPVHIPCNYKVDSRGRLRIYSAKELTYLKENLEYMHPSAIGWAENDKVTQGYAQAFLRQIKAAKHGELDGTMTLEKAKDYYKSYLAATNKNESGNESLVGDATEICAKFFETFALSILWSSVACLTGFWAKFIQRMILHPKRASAIFTIVMVVLFFLIIGSVYFLIVYILGLRKMSTKRVQREKKEKIFKQYKKRFANGESLESLQQETEELKEELTELKLILESLKTPQLIENPINRKIDAVVNLTEIVANEINEDDVSDTEGRNETDNEARRGARGRKTKKGGKAALKNIPQSPENVSGNAYNKEGKEYQPENDFAAQYDTSEDSDMEAQMEAYEDAVFGGHYNQSITLSENESVVTHRALNTTIQDMKKRAQNLGHDMTNFEDKARWKCVGLPLKFEKIKALEALILSSPHNSHTSKQAYTAYPTQKKHSELKTVDTKSKSQPAKQKNGKSEVKATILKKKKNEGVVISTEPQKKVTFKKKPVQPEKYNPHDWKVAPPKNESSLPASPKIEKVHQQHLFKFTDQTGETATMALIGGHLITTAHGPYPTIQPDDEVIVHYYKDAFQMPQEVRAKYVCKHPTDDLRVFKPLNLVGVTSLEAYPLSEEKGDSGVVIVGYGQGGWASTSGRAALTDSFGAYFASTDGGWSGAPVRFSTKQVLGIHKAGADSSGRANAFVRFTDDHIDWLSKLGSKNDHSPLGGSAVM